MLNKLIDLNLPSKISVERREELNRLAIRASNTKAALSNHEDCIGDLRCECYAMLEVYNEIVGIGDSINFYSDVDIAFTNTITDRPKSFESYVQLSSTFRILEKHQDLLYAKLHETQMIVDDLDILEAESFKFNK